MTARFFTERFVRNKPVQGQIPQAKTICYSDLPITSFFTKSAAGIRNCFQLREVFRKQEIARFLPLVACRKWSTTRCVTISWRLRSASANRRWHFADKRRLTSFRTHWKTMFDLPEHGGVSKMNAGNWRNHAKIWPFQNQCNALSARDVIRLAV